MWWAVTALTTVGYGDIYPQTPWGRIIGAATAIVGIGFFALPAGIIGSGFIEVQMDEKNKEIARREESERRESSAADPAAARAQASDELLVLQQAAAAIRRQETTLALSMIEERIAGLSRRL